MNLSKMYDMTWKINNERISAVVYKVNKLLVNCIYPKTVKLSYGLSPKSNVIVSLTSFPERINTVWITIATILNQTVKPGKIILWLAIDQFPKGEDELPERLLDLKAYGLTIRFCDNLYPHKKYYYTMLENPKAVVITVDDDVFYPEYLIEELLKISKKYPRTVCCTWAHRMKFESNGIPVKYSNWEKGIKKNCKPEMNLIPIGIGGVLYPPQSLDIRVFDKERIRKLALKTDDLWLKTMEILNNTKVMKTPMPYKRTYFTVFDTQQNALCKDNVKEDENSRNMNMIYNEFRYELINIFGGDIEITIIWHKHQRLANFIINEGVA